MDRGNHYELAFESYLQAQKLCYVAVDETRRSLLEDATVKSIDFLVFTQGGARLVIDIKGRRFPGGPPQRPRRVWECWSFREDVSGLSRWAEMAGVGFRGLLVFAYWLHPTIDLPAATADLHVYRGRRYLFRAVDVDEYREQMCPRSASWDTVTLPRDSYRALVRPFRDFACVGEVEEVPF